MDKKTTLFEEHKNLGGKMVSFAGYIMPIKYSSEIVEHKNVREKVGLFDVSHMGEIDIIGPHALEFCQKITCNDASKLTPGKIQYSVLCNEKGGGVDDCTLYMMAENHYMFCVNASNIEKDYAFMKQHEISGAEIKNRSNEFDQLAIQGPKAQTVLQKIVNFPLSDIKFFKFATTKIFDKDVIISRTGYTGEDGFEIYIDPTESIKIWNTLLEKGKEENILPIGLGARDSLRLEASYILYGNDLDDDTSPVEANISWTVKLDKGDFLGKSIIEDHKANGNIRKQLVGLKMIDRGIPRSHYPIYLNDNKIGEVSSGGFSPLLNEGIAMAFIKPEYNQIDKEVELEVRGRKLKAKVCKLPFYKR